MEKKKDSRKTLESHDLDVVRVPLECQNSEVTFIFSEGSLLYSSPTSFYLLPNGQDHIYTLVNPLLPPPDLTTFFLPDCVFSLPLSLSSNLIFLPLCRQINLAVNLFLYVCTDITLCVYLSCVCLSLFHFLPSFLFVSHSFCFKTTSAFVLSENFYRNFANFPSTILQRISPGFGLNLRQNRYFRFKK